MAKRADRPYTPGRADSWVKVKRYRTVECVVIGVAGDLATPKLVLGLMHNDGRAHHFGLTRPIRHEQCDPLIPLLERAGPQQPPIPSRWGHDAIPTWRPVLQHLVAEVRVSNLDRARWARFPAHFLRWRPDREPEDCVLDQLSI